LKAQIRQLLESYDLESIASVAGRRKRALGVLVSITYDPDPLIAWRAVEAMGAASERIAGDNPEFIRSHLRRLHWLLSEESGGICRHAPQAMAEIVRRSPDLFADYAPITISLLEDMAEEDLDSGFRPAVLWAIGRLAPVAPERVEAVLPAVEACLDNPDPQVRGVAVWCLAQAGGHDRISARGDLKSDEGPVRLYGGGKLVDTTVGELAGDGRD
jgi:hypothetical protein